MHNGSIELLSAVERLALSRSRFRAQYSPAERIPVIAVDNFPALGCLTAMRFLEWVQANPGGVISLPTGKTPEHFIRWVRYLLDSWDEPKTRAKLQQAGVDPASRPDMKSLQFVQIDEFYPIDPEQHNSFCNYVRRFYIGGFGLDAGKAQLIDCREIPLPNGLELEDVWPEGTVDLSLRHRAPTSELEEMQQAGLAMVDQWCQEYEDRIRARGGIGFFLGGIGPDGHIAFNVRGSDHHCTTRLTDTNYETQAAAASDLGGIETARSRMVITIGLETITWNPDCTAIIIAAGSAKAGVVAGGVESPPDVLQPATALHKLGRARFYVTNAAASQLSERCQQTLERCTEISEEDVIRTVVDLALACGRRVVDLTEEDFRRDRAARTVLARRPESARSLTTMVRDNLVRRIENGATTRTDTCFYHTEPHHDDIMLGYLAGVVRHIRVSTNEHHFANMTSGFTAVTNDFVLQQLLHLRRHIETPEFRSMFDQGYFAPSNSLGRNRDVWQYLDGLAAKSPADCAEGVARRMLRCLLETWPASDLAGVRGRLSELESYLRSAYPGQKDPEAVQKFKGMCREWEADCLWGYFGWNHSHVHSLRLGFYKGDIFTEEPEEDRDVIPIAEHLAKVNPDVVTTVLDPEASGPDTHYKVLQAVTEALKQHERATGRSDISVWGYRNVWYRFHPAEANMYVPVSLNMFAVMRDAFLHAFSSQRNASFPSYEYDGPFCDLAQSIQVEQYQALKTCLGREWFQEHPSPLIRATRGLVFIREMNLGELYSHSRALRKAAENR